MSGPGPGTWAASIPQARGPVSRTSPVGRTITDSRMLSMPNPYLQAMVLMLHMVWLEMTPAVAEVDGLVRRRLRSCASAWSRQ